MKDDYDVRADLEAASDRILSQCKKDILEAVRGARDAEGNPIEGEDRMFLLETFRRGYMRAFIELSNMHEIPLLTILTEMVCDLSMSRNLDGLEEGVHRFLHRLNHAVPDGDLSKLGEQMLNAVKVRVVSGSGSEDLGVGFPSSSKKTDYDVN